MVIVDYYQSRIIKHSFMHYYLCLSVYKNIGLFKAASIVIVEACGFGLLDGR